MLTYFSATFFPSAVRLFLFLIIPVATGNNNNLQTSNLHSKLKKASYCDTNLSNDAKCKQASSSSFFCFLQGFSHFDALSRLPVCKARYSFAPSKFKYRPLTTNYLTQLNYIVNHLIHVIYLYIAIRLSRQIFPMFWYINILHQLLKLHLDDARCRLEIRITHRNNSECDFLPTFLVTK